MQNVYTDDQGTFEIQGAFIAICSCQFQTVHYTVRILESVEGGGATALFEQGSPTELRCYTLCLQYKIHQAHAVPFLAPLATVTQRCKRLKNGNMVRPSSSNSGSCTRAMLHNISPHLA